MEDDTKCEKCGGLMKKEDDKTLKCEACGATKLINEEEAPKEKEEEKK